MGLHEGMDPNNLTPTTEAGPGHIAGDFLQALVTLQGVDPSNELAEKVVKAQAAAIINELKNNMKITVTVNLTDGTATVTVE